MRSPKEIELLAPAANREIAIEAILHGADAVYIGASSHGARKSASNSVDDIKRVVEFAHPYGAKVYVTVNTIIYDDEIQSVENLICELYRIGVDAIIIQDMGILRMNIPPIALHASTQCDTRTPEKAKFLEEMGFSQIVLARELTLAEIKAITDAVSVPVECFIHGALCVSYSGRCHASQQVTGRSANRGECAQLCRWKYNLTDSDGKFLARNKYLLSLKDLNQYNNIETLLQAGVTSFKIEGRLKDATYVKNIVALYRQKIDRIIAENPESYRRSSAGKVDISFSPKADKSFNRGFTHYFLNQRRPREIASLLTPKSMGEEVKNISELHNGDGISYFNKNNEYEGMMVNGVKGNKIIGNKDFLIPGNFSIYRTLDIEWQKKLARPSAQRRLRLDVVMTNDYIKATDERGTSCTLPIDKNLEEARNRSDIRKIFDKLGNSIYYLGAFDDQQFTKFIPASQLSELRRRLINTLKSVSVSTYHYNYRRSENKNYKFLSEEVDYRENIANRLSETFYKEHGVRHIEMALEVAPTHTKSRNTNPAAILDKKENRVIMTTRHCILRELGKCLKDTPQSRRSFHLPLTLESGGRKFPLRFDCRNCQMEVLEP